MSVKDRRGQQCKVGNLSFIFPDEPPITDEEIIDHEELIARIEQRAAKLRKELSKANGYMRALRGDINRTMSERVSDDRQGRLWDPEDLIEGDAKKQAKPKAKRAPAKKKSEAKKRTASKKKAVA